MRKGWFGLPWLVYALVASGIAVVWVFVWPQDRVTAQEGLRFLVVRWGHLLVWVLLALNFWVRLAGPAQDRLADRLALAGGLVYAGFLAATYVF